MTSKLYKVKLNYAYINALVAVEDLILVLAADYNFDIDLAFLIKLRTHVTDSF
jgi:hypothetical protein